MRSLCSIRTSLTKAVPSARIFRVILEVMTQSVSLGRGGTRSASQVPAHPSNTRFPYFQLHFLQLSCRWLLVLGYLSGLQVWDCANLDSITEMLNVSGTEWGSIRTAQVPPGPILRLKASAWLNVGIHFFCYIWYTHKAFPVLIVRIKNPNSLYIPF